MGTRTDEARLAAEEDLHAAACSAASYAVDAVEALLALYNDDKQAGTTRVQAARAMVECAVKLRDLVPTPDHVTIVVDCEGEAHDVPLPLNPDDPFFFDFGDQAMRRPP